MNIFADQCVRLSCDKGVVSFCLESDASQYAGVTVHMPLAAFQAMQEQFAEKLPGFSAAQGGKTDAQKGPGLTDDAQLAQHKGDAAPLGPAFATVTVDTD